MKNNIEEIFAAMQKHDSCAIYYEVSEDNFYLQIDPTMYTMNELFKSGNIKYVATKNVRGFNNSSKKELLNRMIVLCNKLGYSNSMNINIQIEKLIKAMYVYDICKKEFLQIA
ncbi:hypothetical protein [Liquorilactobacillus mali]|uniref:Uncharacterized protein n=1 Tax=Liquorilactobacillus mali KCTC 3596 = DSM 20444 TaxID=1046596 RepID=A0A0R2EF60_9LACO|nr:hypothetical protein [Liquorilactobacillus mali]KRN10788.1 hypothetical protein FD00_GL002030 [Liquorilactobacillus mali KCTC 3596 = DSM 20444]